MIRAFRHRGLKRLWDGDSTRINAAMRDRVSNVLAVLDLHLIREIWISQATVYTN